MIWYVLTGKPRPRTVLMQEAIAAVFAIFFVGPVVWLLLDRTPPVIRLYGTMDPEIVVRGEDARVKYVVTKRTRPESSCPGTVQQEIVDSSGTTFQKLARGTGPAGWVSNPGHPDQEIFYGHPVNIPDVARPGPATFRTVTFRYCNWLQRTWPFDSWPIIQVGPDIQFVIDCRPDERQVVHQDGRRECLR